MAVISIDKPKLDAIINAQTDRSLVLRQCSGATGNRDAHICQPGQCGSFRPLAQCGSNESPLFAVVVDESVLACMVEGQSSICWRKHMNQLRKMLCRERHGT